MIYKVGSSLDQFDKECICSKYVPNFSIMTILLTNEPRNTHFLKSTKNMSLRNFVLI